MFKIFKNFFGKNKNNTEINDSIEQLKIVEESLNKARFEKDGLEFSIEGKYFVKQNYNNKKGYHYAFLIESSKLLYMPEDYEDVCDYESSGFKVSIAYFEDFPLNECEKGIILSKKLEDCRKLITIKQDENYIFCIDTVETDDIDYGEIEVLKSEGEDIFIRFKFIVSAGLCDTVSGIVKLSRDTQNYEE